jgi:hypothetical protein
VGPPGASGTSGGGGVRRRRAEAWGSPTEQTPVTPPAPPAAARRTVVAVTSRSRVQRPAAGVNASTATVSPPPVSGPNLPRDDEKGPEEGDARAAPPPAPAEPAAVALSGSCGAGRDGWRTPPRPCMQPSQQQPHPGSHRQSVTVTTPELPHRLFDDGSGAARMVETPCYKVPTVRTPSHTRASRRSPGKDASRTPCTPKSASHTPSTPEQPRSTSLRGSLAHRPAAAAAALAPAVASPSLSGAPSTPSRSPLCQAPAARVVATSASLRTPRMPTADAGRSPTASAARAAGPVAQVIDETRSPPAKAAKSSVHSSSLRLQKPGAVAQSPPSVGAAPSEAGGPSLAREPVQQRSPLPRRVAPRIPLQPLATPRSAAGNVDPGTRLASCVLEGTASDSTTASEARRLRYGEAAIADKSPRHTTDRRVGGAGALVVVMPAGP